MALKKGQRVYDSARFTNRPREGVVIGTTAKGRPLVKVFALDRKYDYVVTDYDFDWQPDPLASRVKRWFKQVFGA